MRLPLDVRSITCLGEKKEEGLKKPATKTASIKVFFSNRNKKEICFLVIWLINILGYQIKVIP